MTHGNYIPDDLKPGIDVDLFMVRGRVRAGLEVVRQWTNIENGQAVEYEIVKWTDIDRLKWQQVNYRHKIAACQIALMYGVLKETDRVAVYQELQQMTDILNYVRKQLGKLDKSKPPRQRASKEPPKQTNYEEQCQ